MSYNLVEIIRKSAIATGNSLKQELMEFRDVYLDEAKKQGIELNKPGKKDLDNPIYLGYKQIENALAGYKDMPNFVRDQSERKKDMGCYIPVGL